MITNSNGSGIATIASLVSAAQQVAKVSSIRYLEVLHLYLCIHSPSAISFIDLGTLHQLPLH